MILNTHETAKHFGISANSLTKLAKQLGINKNAKGHYIYHELDIEKIATHLTSTKSKNIAEAPPIQEQLNSLELRLRDTESAVKGKADDVVSYQLLQHRQELEDLHKKIAAIENKMSIMEDQLISYSAVAAAKEIPSKKKGFFKSILKL